MTPPLLTECRSWIHEDPMTIFEGANDDDVSRSVSLRQSWKPRAVSPLCVASSGDDNQNPPVGRVNRLFRPLRHHVSPLSFLYVYVYPLFVKVSLGWMVCCPSFGKNERGITARLVLCIVVCCMYVSVITKQPPAAGETLPR